MPAELSDDELPTTLLVVGSSPTSDEDRRMRPFSGDSGQYFRGLVAKHWHGAVVYDYALRCAQRRVKLAPSMISACRPYLANSFEHSRPARIICLGSEAITSVFGRSFPVLSVRRGYGYTSTGAPVFFLMHPSQATRNRFLRAWFEDDLRWALTATPTPLPHDAAAFLVKTSAEAVEAAEDLRCAPWVTFDIESFGSPFNVDHQILNLAFTPGESDYSYVVDKAQLEDEQVFAPFRRLLEDSNVPKGGHGVKFDMLGLFARYDVRVRNVTFDTLLSRRLLDADAEGRLETCQALVGMGGAKDEIAAYLKDGAKELRTLFKKPDAKPAMFREPSAALRRAAALIDQGEEPKRYTYDAIPSDVRTRYNAADTISTDRIKSLLDADFAEQPEIRQVWAKITRRLNNAVAAMERNGIGVSPAKILELQKMADAKIAASKGRLAQFGGFNPNSQPQVAELLYKTLGLPVLQQTGKGAPSVAAGVLEHLHHPVVQDILDYRRATHFKSQYADGMAFFVRDDGRIHPGIKIAGTTTGRPSCEEPNLLNIPRAESVDGKLCRDIFVADRGWSFVELDQSQIELRVAAMLSGDPVMTALFVAGEDFHLATARLIAPVFKRDPATLTKGDPLRTQAKAVNFSVLYGKDSYALAAEMGISAKAAQAIVEAILGKFQRLRVWIQQSLAFGQKHGYCRTWWDGQDFRRRPLWKIADHNDDERKTAERGSWNTPIQGTAAEFTNASLGAVQEWIEESPERERNVRLVLTVYDSMLLEVRDEFVVDTARHCKKIAESWPSNGVPLLSDVKVGKSWGSMTKLDTAGGL
jgi:uracil-DNA glycosylase family 4